LKQHGDHKMIAKNILIGFTEKQVEFLKKMKAETGNSYSAIIRSLIEQEIKKQKDIEKQQQTDKEAA